MRPLTLFRRVAVAEAVTWALLLVGMVLKHATQTTDLGVRVFGMLHGVVFLGYCLATLVVGVDRRWSASRLVVGLAAAVPPFATLAFERYAARRRADDPRADDPRADDPPWRLTTEPPLRLADRPVAWLLRHPARGLAVGVLGLATLTGAALLVGPSHRLIVLSKPRPGEGVSGGPDGGRSRWRGRRCR